MQSRTSVIVTMCCWSLAAPVSAHKDAATASYPDKPVRVIVPVAADRDASP